MYAEMSGERKPFVIVAGATDGLGSSFGYECAARGNNLLLVGSNRQALEELSDSLQNKFSVEILVLETDLMKEEAPSRVLDKIIIEEIDVFMLINNTGLDQKAVLAGQDVSEIRGLCDREGEASMALVKALLPELQMHFNSYVINVGSLALYCLLSGRSSCWVTNNFFSQHAHTLRTELRNYSISVSTLCPGLMILNAGEGMRRMRSNLLTRAMTMKPNELAALVLDNAVGGTKTTIPGRFNWLLYNTLSLLPGALRRSIMMQVMRWMQKSSLRLGHVTDSTKVQVTS